jgi:NADPH:quinone reductase-like Zn-dependent oxidoreductase
MITTTAWVLYQDPERRGLFEEEFSFPDLEADEALIEPLYGCWEANMSHAIEHQPVNIVRLRREQRIVLGNAGVVRVLKAGDAVTKVREGDVCMFCSAARMDQHGYISSIHGYDARHTVGLLAKRTKIRGEALVRLPQQTRFSLQQWAGFSLRYMTAWSNWKVAHGAFRLQVSEEDMARPHVWGWGGGTTFAELDLARRMGCNAVMISGTQSNLDEIAEVGIDAVDRREFIDLEFDAERIANDRDYRDAYQRSERTFLRIVREKTQDEGVSIFVDFIGSPVYRATLRALGREGVVTTAGWKKGMDLTTNRASECIGRHIHVFTHAARRGEEVGAMDFAERTGWMPKVTVQYSWDGIGKLAGDFDAGQVASYFPVFEINPV